MPSTDAKPSASERGAVVFGRARGSDILQPEPIPPPGATRGTVERCLDAFAADTSNCCGIEAPPYFVLGVAGVSLGFTILLGTGLAGGVPVSHTVSFAVLALLVFVVAAQLRRALGHGTHVLLEDVVLVSAATAGLAWVLGAPVWPSVDRMVLALGGFLVFGRLGCLASGCCHGRAARWGVRYPDGSVAPGLVGIPLFPIQLAEACWIALVTTGAGCLLDLPGAAVCFWLAGYCAGRFVFEVGRGDVNRVRLGPMTEAQWTALLLLAVIVALESRRAGWPLREAAVLLGAVAVVVVGWLSRSWWLAVPSPVVHEANVAAWLTTLRPLDDLRPGAQGVRLATPRPGLTITASLDRTDGGWSLLSLRVDASDVSRREHLLVAGVVTQRFAVVRFLRAEMTVDGYALWAAVLLGARPTLAVHPSHLVQRARAFATALERLVPSAENSPNGAAHTIRAAAGADRREHEGSTPPSTADHQRLS